MKPKQADISPVEVNQIVEFLKSNGAGSHIQRSDVGKVSCGMLNSGTLANADSAGVGVDERITFGKMKKVSYPIESLALYMTKRGFVIEKRIKDFTNHQNKQL